MVTVKKRGCVSIVDITDGTKERQEAFMTFTNANHSAKQYGGKILNHSDIEGGYSLMVFFENEELKNLWEGSIGLQ